jgi:1-acyl-sn-glycerol-3-phosphate acyltransferase
MARDEAVSALVERLELPFNQYGVDPYGISKKHLAFGFSVLAFLYRRYFRVKAVGIEHVPKRGRAMLVGNHSGGYALDGAMVLTSMMLEMDPPRLAQGMVEKFLNELPVSSLWSSRMGQLTGLPEHAERLLNDDRLLMVFPEGAKGTAKLFKERYSLVEFGTGFIRLALKTKTPIVPLGFVGGADAVPTIHNSATLGKLLGVPYVPVTPYGIAAPLPAKLVVHYGEPMHFTGTGDEEDSVVKRYVDQVKERIAQLIEAARADRRGEQGRGR